jgi:hypothetical protein
MFFVWVFIHLFSSCFQENQMKISVIGTFESIAKWHKQIALHGHYIITINYLTNIK